MDNDEVTFDVSNMLSTVTITTVPSTPNVGDIWFDSTNSMINTYNGTDWATIIGDNGTINLDELSFPIPVEWEHEFPAFHKVKEMCKEYPALEKAYENFKTIYTMVEQDWIGKQKEQDT
jgi:hypothetical protein